MDRWYHTNVGRSKGMPNFFIKIKLINRLHTCFIYNQVDIAFASIWVTLDQNEFVTLSVPWYDVYLHFLVPRPRRTTSFWALKKPFSKKIWCLLLSALLLHSLYTCARSWIDSKFPKRKKKKKKL